ncbi:ornithine cyclodeaminase family protein [Nocardioides sp. GXQ0305]|uniref:ornithine cyclodeaminase family protein n=1 Tax=Nocardioides sp. GXQ0305 TaxID=3423912 RepID=UPI003D7D9361
MTVVTLGPEQVRAAVPMADAVAAVRRAFVDLAAGHFEMPTRTALRDGQLLDMACHHRPSGTAVFKLLSLNFAGRDPAILGSVVWSDVEGSDQLVADATVVTTLRTGAVSGVATDLLAPPDARRLVVVGTGAQAPDQVRAVHAVRPLESVTLVGRDRGRAERLAGVLADELPGVEVTATTDPGPALARAEVVCCATTATEPLFGLDDLPDRVHVNAIGSYRPTMRELPDELLGDGLVVVDERGAILEEAGEVLHAIDAGVLTIDDTVELGVALTGGVEPTPRTTFKSVGVAAQDWAVGRLLADAFLE